MERAVREDADPLDLQFTHRPYEHATITSNTYWDWYFDHVYLLVPMQAYVAQFLQTFREYPPRQKAASFTVDQVMEQLTQSLGSK